MPAAISRPPAGSRRPASRKWNGSQWQGLGAGVNGRVNAFATFDDGSGPALYVGGDFTRAGGAPASNIAK